MTPPPPDFPSLNKSSLDGLTVSDLAPFDMVINCLPVSCNQQVLALVATSECGYMDLATDQVDIPEHMAYQRRFNNRPFLANAGIAPGLDNILIAQLVKRGAKDIRLYLIEHLYANGAGLSWCEEDAITTLNDRPVSFTAGEFKQHDNFSEPEQVSTSQGDFVCYRFFGEEILSLGRTFQAVNLSLKAGGSEIEAARHLFNHGFEPETDPSAGEPDGIFGVKIISDAGNVEIFFKPSHQLWREGLPGNYISFHTAYVAYTMLKIALRHNLKGFYFPEMLPDTLQNEILQNVRKHACFWKFE